jgi:hypothetical protein
MIVANKSDPTRAYSQYAAHSLIIAKNNFDGSPITPTKLLCGFETVDLQTPFGGKTLLDANNKGNIMLVLTYQDGHTEQKFISLDFTALAATLNAVTPAQLIPILNAHSGDTINFQARAWNQPGRTAINFMCKDPSVFRVQVYSDLANALGFGGGRPWIGCGAKMFDFYNEDLATGITDAPVTTDGINTPLMGMYSNAETSVNTSSRTTGDDITVTLKARYAELEAVLKNTKMSIANGDMGKLATARDITNSEDGALGGFECWIPKSLYEAVGAQNLGDSKQIDLDHVFSATLERAAPSGGAVTLTTFSFIIHAKTYTDDNGQQFLQPATEPYTNPCAYITNLSNAAKNAPMMSMVDITALTGATIENVTVIANGQRDWASIAPVPTEASGYSVAIAEPETGALGCSFAYDPDAQIIVVISGTTTGTETVTATFTNRDASTVTATFDVTVTS